jgi:Uma2 family endonuclease
MSAVLNEPLQPHRFTREQYERMVEAGVFAPGERLELLEGEIVNMVPQKSPHATAISLVSEALRKVLKSDCHIRVQMPLALSDASEPEPDVAVVRGVPRDYAGAHPATALLVIEVADSTVQYDRRRKLPVYARADIPEYWILDLNNSTLEAYREPSGSEYRQSEVYRSGQNVQPLGVASATVAISDLLP